MRYWAYFAAKLSAGGAVLYGLLAGLNAVWPKPPQFYSWEPPAFGSDLLYTSIVGIWFLICCGALYLIVLDQRYRCRVCLRRLRMPIVTGSWGRMLLLGRPRVEYICPYGHGKLNVDELQITGSEVPEWTPQGELWEELCAASRDSDKSR